MSQSEFVTTQQAAEELGITDSRVRQLVLDGTLPAQKFGRSHMIRRRDLKLVPAAFSRGRPRKSEVAKLETNQLRMKTNGAGAKRK